MDSNPLESTTHGGRSGAPIADADTPRPLSVIAAEIRKTWRKKDGSPAINYAAAPYLDAMSSLDKITDQYYCDDAKSIVIYFLGNAQTWRGDDARRIKAELKALYE